MDKKNSFRQFTMYGINTIELLLLLLLDVTQFMTKLPQFLLAFSQLKRVKS